MRKLSELEGVCLGIIRKQQPCTAYRVRGELKKAPSSHWQASAGSVYPLLERLEDDGLVATTADEKDGRGRKLLKVTAKGRKALQAWISAGADMLHVSSVTDPVRSRMFFLDALPAPKRREYANELIALMESYLADTKARLGQESEAEDLYDYLASLGAVKITEARLEWLRVVRKRLK